MRSIVTLSFIFSFLISGAQGKSTDDHKKTFQKLSWIEGTWMGTRDGGNFYESWTFTNDTVLCNQHYTVKGSDKVFTSRAQIELHNGNIIYRQDAQSGQNQLLMALKNSNKSRMKFENESFSDTTGLVYELKDKENLQIKITTRSAGENKYLLRKLD